LVRFHLNGLALYRKKEGQYDIFALLLAIVIHKDVVAEFNGFSFLLNKVSA